MKKTTVLSLILSLSCVSFLFGFDVYEDELLSTRDTAVEFINYVGPHSKIETIEQIMGVGEFLGESIGTGYSVARYGDKYRVIHAVGESPDEGLIADIFMVLEGAEVDHIDNMRYMIAGFLISAYDFTPEDALLLARFVTIYNAVYRGKMDFFNANYKQVVTRNLNPEAAGISTVYTDWPGKTEMVIPLTETAAEGGLGSLDTDALTEDAVIEEMREQPDRGLEDRKDITELKEREVEKEQEEIEEEREALETERERITTERERIEEQREEVAEERAEADTDSEIASADERVEALDREEEQLDSEETELSEREEDLADREEEQAERIDLIQEEREEIAADERELMEEEVEGDETELAAATGARPSTQIALYLEIRDLGGEPLGRLVLIDTATGAITGASTLNNVRNRKVENLGPRYVVIAGTTSGQGAVRLMTLEKESLNIGSEGEDDIYPESALITDGASVFAVTGDGETWKLGKFDSTLALQELSEIEVYQDTALTIMESSLFVVGADGVIHALSTADLADLGTIR